MCLLQYVLLHGKRERIEPKLETKLNKLCRPRGSAGPHLSKTGGELEGRDAHLGTGESGSMSTMQDLAWDGDGDQGHCMSLASSCSQWWGSLRVSLTPCYLTERKGHFEVWVTSPHLTAWFVNFLQCLTATTVTSSGQLDFSWKSINHRQS